MSDPPSTVRRKVVLSALALGFITMVLVVVATARL
jgi:hypothetical protein